MTPLLGTKTLIRARRGQVGWGQKNRPVAAFLRVVERHGAAMARHGRPPSPAPATRPVGFSPATNHETWFPLSLRRLQGDQSQARPTGFNESRDTAFSPWMRKGHTVRNHRPDRRARRPIAAFLRIVERHGAAMARHGRPPSPAQATRPFRSFPFTGRQTFLLERTRPPSMVFTKHETRVTKHGFFSNHDFPRFPTISRHFPAPPPPSAVLARLPGARRQPQLPPPSGLVPLRPRHNEPMLRKENILDCTNSGTFYLASAIARLESPLRSGHHREQRRSGTARGLTRSTTGRGLRRRDMPSGQETISKRR